MMSSIVKSATIAVAMVISTAEAHNLLLKPSPTWPNDFWGRNSPSGTIDPTTYLPCPSGMSYNTDPSSNVVSFWTAFNASNKYDSVRDFIWKTQKLEKNACQTCGFSLVDGTPQELPDMIQWDGFTVSHTGPVVTYCDDVLVSESGNAAAEFTQAPANMPYDKTKCKGAKFMSSYWLAMHTTPWQVYTNCASLIGGSSNKSTNSDTSNAPSGTRAITPTDKTDKHDDKQDDKKDDNQYIKYFLRQDGKPDDKLADKPGVVHAAPTTDSQTVTQTELTDGYDDGNEDTDEDDTDTSKQTEVGNESDESEITPPPPRVKCLVRRRHL